MHSIDIYQVANNKHEKNVLVETIDIANEDLCCVSPKLIKFCEDNNVYGDDDMLRCNNTNVVKYIIK